MALKKAKQDTKSVKESSAETAKEIRTSSDNAVKAAKVNLQRTQNLRKGMGEGMGRKKKYRETVSRMKGPA